MRINTNGEMTDGDEQPYHFGQTKTIGDMLDSTAEPCLDQSNENKIKKKK